MHISEIQHPSTTILTKCTKMSEEGHKFGMNGNADRNIKEECHKTNYGQGGRLKFFKDGKFILELERAREGERVSWVSVPRKTFWPPQGTAASTPAYRQDNSTSLSVSDDNSSIQSSPWQRDHSWKQANPSKNISKELKFYFWRPKHQRTMRRSNKRRQPLSLTAETQLDDTNKNKSERTYVKVKKETTMRSLLSIIQYLTDKCFRTRVSSKDDKIKIISLLPSSWSKKKIVEDFGASEHMVKLTRQLVKDQGVLPHLSKRQGNKISEAIFNCVKEFYEDDENSHLCPDVVSNISNDDYNIPSEKIKLRLNKAVDLLDNFGEIQSEIECHVNDLEEEASQRELFEKDYFSITKTRSSLLKSNPNEVMHNINSKNDVQSQAGPSSRPNVNSLDRILKIVFIIYFQQVEKCGYPIYSSQSYLHGYMYPFSPVPPYYGTGVYGRGYVVPSMYHHSSPANVPVRHETPTCSWVTVESRRDGDHREETVTDVPLNLSKNSG
uniref:Uncharacterized protein LOC114343548 n=1 Tax=Diabrotica virgifera virgifera TaxID=50390 RepID=A0A6P7GXP5_DIAVI